MNRKKYKVEIANGATTGILRDKEGNPIGNYEVIK